MTNFCPQCGSRVAQGAQICPQCGSQLRMVFQSNSNSNLGAGYNSSGIRKRDTMVGRTAYVENTDPMSFVGQGQGGMTLKHNVENVELGEVTFTTDEDMSIIGVTEDTVPAEIEQDNPKETQGTVEGMPSFDLNSMMGSSKYRIVTQVYDKKTGFNAVELESKLNMYAKMGYHIVPNTMICQPGQDFFALMEKNGDTAQPVANPKTKE